jgi:hypothetical protein
VSAIGAQPHKARALAALKRGFKHDELAIIAFKPHGQSPTRKRYSPDPRNRLNSPANSAPWASRLIALRTQLRQVAMLQAPGEATDQFQRFDHRLVR